MGKDPNPEGRGEENPTTLLYILRSSKISANVQRGVMSSVRHDNVVCSSLHLCFITPVRLRTGETKNKFKKYIDVRRRQGPGKRGRVFCSLWVSSLFCFVFFSDGCLL